MQAFDLLRTVTNFLHQACRLDRGCGVRGQRPKQGAVLAGQRLAGGLAVPYYEQRPNPALDLHCKQVARPGHRGETAGLDSQHRRGAESLQLLVVQFDRTGVVRRRGETHRPGAHQHIGLGDVERFANAAAEPLQERLQVRLGGQLAGPVEQRRTVAVAFAIECFLHTHPNPASQRWVAERHDEQAHVARAAAGKTEQVAKRFAKDEYRHEVDAERAKNRARLLEPTHQQQIEIVETVAGQRGGKRGWGEQQRHHGDELRPARQLRRAERPRQVVEQDERRQAEEHSTEQPAHLRAPRPGQFPVGARQHEDRPAKAQRQQEWLETVAHLERSHRIRERVGASETVGCDPPRDGEDRSRCQVGRTDPPAAGTHLAADDGDPEVQQQRRNQRPRNDVEPVDRPVQQVSTAGVAQRELRERGEGKQRERGATANLGPAQRDQESRNPERQSNDRQVGVRLAAGVVGDLHRKRFVFRAAQDRKLDALVSGRGPAQLTRVERRVDRPAVNPQQQIALPKPGAPGRSLGIDLQREGPFPTLNPLHTEHRHGGFDAVEERNEAEPEQRQRSKDDQRLAGAKTNARHGRY